MFVCAQRTCRSNAHRYRGHGFFSFANKTAHFLCGSHFGPIYSETDAGMKRKPTKIWLRTESCSTLCFHHQRRHHHHCFFCPLVRLTNNGAHLRFFFTASQKEQFRDEAKDEKSTKCHLDVQMIIKFWWKKIVQQQAINRRKKVWLQISGAHTHIKCSRKIWINARKFMRLWTMAVCCCFCSTVEVKMVQCVCLYIYDSKWYKDQKKLRKNDGRQNKKT